MKKKIIIAVIICVVVAAAITATVLLVKKNKKNTPIIDIEGVKQTINYKVGSNSKSGNPQDDEDPKMYYINTICYNHGCKREDFNLLNPKFENSMWIMEGVTVQLMV